MTADPSRGRDRRVRRGISAGQLPCCFCPVAQDCGRTQVSASGTMWRMEQTAKPVPRLRGRLGSCADGGGNEEKKKKSDLNKTSAGGSLSDHARTGSLPSPIQSSACTQLARYCRNRAAGQRKPSQQPWARPGPSEPCQKRGFPSVTTATYPVSASPIARRQTIG